MTHVVDASPSSAATFVDWISGRKLESVGTNFGATPLAFQRWHNVKEAFAPELINRAISQSERAVKRVYDPFGGSGTTALAAQFLGVYPVTSELNPYLADVIEAKLSTYDLTTVIEAAESIKSSLQEYLASPTHQSVPWILPQTFVEPGKSERWIFSSLVMSFVAEIVAAINKLVDASLQRLFRVLLGGVLVKESNVRVSGKGRRYRSNWESNEKTPAHVFAMYVTAIDGAVQDIRRFGRRLEPAFELLRGDSIQLAETIDPIDLAIFSPPYPNSFDYTDIYNVELWTLGYFKSWQANSDLRRQTLASHVQISREFAQAPVGSDELESTISKLLAVESDLWSRHIPSMIGGYFSDMKNMISRVSKKLETNGEIWMVVGDSRYAGVHIPVATILGELCDSLDLETVSNEPVRSMRSSPQHGGEKELFESLIVLRA